MLNTHDKLLQNGKCADNSLWTKNKKKMYILPNLKILLLSNFHFERGDKSVY